VLLLLQDNEFDMAVGAIEDILMDGEFVGIQTAFCERHCAIFTDDEENKLEYMPLFVEYTELIESVLQRMLTERLSGFNMRKFEEDIAARKDEVSGEIFDLLLSMGDFTEFKDLMLSHKRAMASGGAATGRDLQLCGHALN
jgi:ADP-ribosylation factor 2-binding protein